MKVEAGLPVLKKKLTASVDVKPTKEEEALVYDIFPPRRKVPESEAWSVISTLSDCADNAVGQLR